MIELNALWIWIPLYIVGLVAIIILMLNYVQLEKLWFISIIVIAAGALPPIFIGFIINNYTDIDWLSFAVPSLLELVFVACANVNEDDRTEYFKSVMRNLGLYILLVIGIILFAFFIASLVRIYK